MFSIVNGFSNVFNMVSKWGDSDDLMVNNRSDRDDVMVSNRGDSDDLMMI